MVLEAEEAAAADAGSERFASSAVAVKAAGRERAVSALLGTEGRRAGGETYCAQRRRECGKQA